VRTVRAYLDTLEQAGFSGSVLVEFHGNVVISEGYGYSDLLQRRRNPHRTVFDVGSITKQFTAAAIMKIRNGRVNGKGYELLREGNAKQAIGVFRLNVLAFPGSSNAYDSLGEAYLVAGDTTLAIENYRKCLALDPASGNAKEVLKSLLGK